MIYPKFIEKGETIGICAPSAGVGKRLDEYLTSLDNIKKCGYKIKETQSVRVNNLRSCSAKKRAIELDELVSDNNVKTIMCATGGDYMFEMLPYVNFKHIVDNQKWIMGHSDPTNLLFPVTTKYDIATIYGYNAISFEEINKAQNDNLAIMSGDIVKQTSFNKYQLFTETIDGVKTYDHDVKWLGKNNFKVEGRIIGGCLDVIAKLVGTKFDAVNEFLEKYKEDGFIWYFDIFAMSAYDTYLTLLQLKNADYFKYCKAVLFGRVAFIPEGNKVKDYYESYKRALRKIPFVYEADIGHTSPHMTFINGSMGSFEYKDYKGTLIQKLI